MAESCRVILQTFLCAFHGVSPRDRWLRVLPGWQMNVNVNFTDFKLTARPQVVRANLYQAIASRRDEILCFLRASSCLAAGVCRESMWGNLHDLA